MPLFICTKCNAIENTALGQYWPTVGKDSPALCSECLTGKWHGRFPKEIATPQTIAKNGRERFMQPNLDDFLARWPADERLDAVITDTKQKIKDRFEGNEPKGEV